MKHQSGTSLDRETIIEIDAKQPSATRVPQTVIFLHGRAHAPDSVHQIASCFPQARIIAPPGGIALKRGYTWVENERIGVPIPASVADARERFETWLASAVPHESDLWLCGFSNGGVFAGQLLLSHPERYRGAIFLCAPFVLPPWPPNGLRGNRIFLARGTRDAVVPREFYICSDHYLRGESGAHVVTRTYDSGHEITSAMASEAGAWFSESLAE